VGQLLFIWITESPFQLQNSFDCETEENYPSEKNLNVVIDAEILSICLILFSTQSSLSKEDFHSHKSIERCPLGHK
jgi:hypothetical protein